MQPLRDDPTSRPPESASAAAPRASPQATGLPPASSAASTKTTASSSSASAAPSSASIRTGSPSFVESAHRSSAPASPDLSVASLVDPAQEDDSDADDSDRSELDFATLDEMGLPRFRPPPGTFLGDMDDYDGEGEDEGGREDEDEEMQPEEEEDEEGGIENDAVQPPPGAFLGDMDDWDGTEGNSTTSTAPAFAQAGPSTAQTRDRTAVADAIRHGGAPLTRRWPVATAAEPPASATAPAPGLSADGTDANGLTGEKIDAPAAA